MFAIGGFAFCFLLFAFFMSSFVQTKNQNTNDLQNASKLFHRFSSFYLLCRIYLFFLIIVYLDVVNDRRRRPKYYPLNIRHHGYSFQDLKLTERIQLFSEFFLAEFLHDPTIDRRNILLICLLEVLVVSGNRLAISFE